MSMQALFVGKPYHPDRRSWPEGADYNYHASQHELRIFRARAKPEEVKAIDSGPVEFGLLIDSEGLLLVTRFGRLLSFGCTYHWHRVDLTDCTLAPPDEETSPALQALITIVLVEATTGLVLGLRTVSFSPEFTRALHRAIHGQVVAPFDPDTHGQWADGMLRFTTEQLWDKTTVRCRGGE
jgi:hypothetical protein